MAEAYSNAQNVPQKQWPRIKSICLWREEVHLGWKGFFGSQTRDSWRTCPSSWVAYKTFQVLKGNKVGAEGKENKPYTNQRWASSIQSSVKLGGLLRGGPRGFFVLFLLIMSFLSCCFWSITLPVVPLVLFFNGYRQERLGSSRDEQFCRFSHVFWPCPMLCRTHSQMLPPIQVRTFLI